MFKLVILVILELVILELILLLSFSVSIGMVSEVSDGTEVVAGPI